MKKSNWIIICDVVSIALFIVSIILSSNSSTVAIGTVCLCGGFAILGVGTYFSRKQRAQEEQAKQDENKDEKQEENKENE